MDPSAQGLMHAQELRPRLPNRSFDCDINCRTEGAFGVAPARRMTGSRKSKKPLQIKDLQRFCLLLAEWTGLEPATPGVTGRYSNQLNYHSSAVKLVS